MSQIDCSVYKMLENKDVTSSQRSEQQKNMSMLRFHLSAAAVRPPAGCLVPSHGFLTAGSEQTRSAESLFTCCLFLQRQRTHRLQENKLMTQIHSQSICWTTKCLKSRTNSYTVVIIISAPVTHKLIFVNSYSIHPLKNNWLISDKRLFSFNI